jgi:hypothetical protein
MPSYLPIEALIDAYDHFTRVELGAGNLAVAESRLLDACIDCGMPYDEPSVREWAAIRVTRELCSGVDA